jgi:hypothetical protein
MSYRHNFIRILRGRHADIHSALRFMHELFASNNSGDILKSQHQIWGNGNHKACLSEINSSVLTVMAKDAHKESIQTVISEDKPVDFCRRGDRS